MDSNLKVVTIYQLKFIVKILFTQLFFFFYLVEVILIIYIDIL